MRIFASIFAVLAGVIFLASSATAQVEIYAVGSVFNNVVPSITGASAPDVDSRVVDMFGATNLYKVNPDNGQPSLIGPTGYYSCQGLELHPITEDLYAVCNEPIVPPVPSAETTTNTEISGGQLLVMLDKVTGQGTEIGPLGGNIGIPNRGAFASDISFHPDGTLFVYIVGITDQSEVFSETETKFEGTIIENSLGTIDLETGEFSLIGTTNEWDFYSAIGFSNALNLLQCANVDDGPFNNGVNLNRLNQETGSATFIQELTLPLIPVPAINIISSKDADTISGIFYGLFLVDDIRRLAENSLVETNNIDQEGNYLIRLNPLNGNLEVIGLIEGGPEAYLGIAVKTLPRNVPTMSEYGLMATAVILLGASVLYLRRRQTKIEA